GLDRRRPHHLAATRPCTGGTGRHGLLHPLRSAGTRFLLLRTGGPPDQCAQPAWPSRPDGIGAGRNAAAALRVPRSAAVRRASLSLALALATAAVFAQAPYNADTTYRKLVRDYPDIRIASAEAPAP